MIEAQKVELIIEIVLQLLALQTSSKHEAITNRNYGHKSDDRARYTSGQKVPHL